MRTTEPDDLTSARRHLARAEAALMTADGLFDLKEGLALLESVIDDSAGTEAESVARNLARTYTGRTYARVRQHVESADNLPEPQLEHLFAVMRAFDDSGIELPPESARLKIDVVRRLIDLYYEGYPAAEKEKALMQLAKLSRGT